MDEPFNIYQAIKVLIGSDELLCQRFAVVKIEGLWGFKWVDNYISYYCGYNHPVGHNIFRIEDLNIICLCDLDYPILNIADPNSLIKLKTKLKQLLQTKLCEYQVLESVYETIR